jgi:type I restriction enzyme, S subunit
MTMSDVMVELHDGPHATPPPADDGPIFLGIRNITESGRLDLSEVRHIAEEDFDRWTRRAMPQPGDVVFTYEATLHRYALIPQGFRGCLGRRLALIRPDTSVVLPRYLHFAMLGPLWRATVVERVIGGATVDRIPIIDFSTFPIALPDTETQSRVVEILGALDDLIENNRRRITLLEQMARAIYREWFVHFRYPGHEDDELVDSPRGAIPRGWSLTPLGELGPAMTVSVDPSEVEPGTPSVGLEHMPRRSFTLSEWGTASDLTSRKSRFAAGDVLFGKIRPYFHKVCVAPVDGIASTDAIVVRPVREARGLVTMTMFSDDFVAHAVATSNGTKMPRADWKVLREWLVPIPPDAMLSAFEVAVASTVDFCNALAFQCRTLAELRNLLLPKLVTGAIDVSKLNLDAVVDAA